MTPEQFQRLSTQLDRIIALLERQQPQTFIPCGPTQYVPPQVYPAAGTATSNRWTLVVGDHGPIPGE